MYLLIDFREKDFINKLSEYCMIENDLPTTIKINNIELNFKICNLLVGDFIIQSESNISDTLNVGHVSGQGTNIIESIIERKSIRDLCSSIMDGRFREQKSRLLDSIGDASKICYIIEGRDKLPVQNCDKKNNLSKMIRFNKIFKN